MFIVMIRTVILYILVVIILRLMGKRQIGELEPFELVIAIMVSELAALPMQDVRIPLIHGVIPIVTLLMLQLAITVLEIKSEKAGAIITGTPSIIIKNGEIDIQELRNQRLSYNDLMEELRLNGYFNISDIQYAILETSGQLSIMPKNSSAQVTREDLKLNIPEEKLPINIILDGKLNQNNLKISNKNKEWVLKQLKSKNIDSIENAFLATIDSKGNFFCQVKEKQSPKSKGKK